MRGQAQRILEESEAQRAQAEAEFEIQLAARREEAERQEAERHAAAQAATQKLVSEAEQRAATAEQRAAKATQQAEQTRREADPHAKQLVANAKKNADQIVAEAKARPSSSSPRPRPRPSARRTAAQREVDELTRQRDSITTHLAQLRQLLGGARAPGLRSRSPPIAAAPAEAGHPAATGQREARPGAGPSGRGRGRGRRRGVVAGVGDH